MNQAQLILLLPLCQACEGKDDKTEKLMMPFHCYFPYLTESRWYQLHEKNDRLDRIQMILGSAERQVLINRFRLLRLSFEIQSVIWAEFLAGLIDASSSPI